MNNELFEKVANAKKNLIVAGDVASGKTSNIMFPIVNNAIEKQESLLILDPKEEYINMYYNKLKEKNYNTIVINLRDVDKSDGWNPLEYPYTLFKDGNRDKAQEYLEKIGRTMFYDQSTQDMFWTTAAQDFFTGVTLGLFEDGELNEVSINSVNNMMNGVEKRFGATDYITEYFKLKDPTSKPYIIASTTFLAPKDTKGGILSTARQKLNLYVSREKISQLMNKTTFNYDDIINKPTAIFLIGRDENRVLNPIVTMFIEQLYAILIDLKSKNRFNFVLDSFDIIEKCNDLVDILSSCTARNIKVYIGTRSVSELKNVYGEYVTRLCDLLLIGNDNIKLTINNIEETHEKNFSPISIDEKNIEYPTLNSDPIELFPLESFVATQKTKLLGAEYDNKKTNESKIDIDALMNDIDARLKKIDEEEKNENKQ